MYPYWLLFSLWAAAAIQFNRRQHLVHLPFNGLLILTALAIGLRFEVGGDWFNYLEIKNTIYFMSLGESLAYIDPAYAFLNWTSNQFDIGIWLTNLICGAIFTIGLGRLASAQPNPSLAILIAVPYFIIVVAMGYTRQAAAIGIVCYALATASEDRIWRLVGLICIAAMFHKSAVLVLPVVLIPVFRKNVLIASVGGMVFVGIFSVFLAGSSDQLVAGYINSGLESQGALIRVSMNVVASVMLLLLSKRFQFTPFMHTYWMANALLSILSLAGLFIGVGSTAIDRLALFLIPLQVVIFSRLPYVLSSKKRAVPSVLLGVIGYSFLVQAVWLNFADNSFAWLPYSTTIFHDES